VATPAEKAPVLSEAQLQQKEDEDARKTEKFLPVLEEKVQTAEDESEKVSILAAPLAMEADEELRELQLAAVRDTERAVRASTTLITATKREIDKRKAEIVNFAPAAKETAEEELHKFASRLDGAQAKIDEFKTVRKDHEAATAAGKLIGELSMRIAGLEIDCEKAAMMAEPIGKALDNACASDVSPTEIRETKEALRIAQATLAPTHRLIQGKISGLKGPMKNKMADLQAKLEASQALIEKAQKMVEECQASAAVVPLLKQANERLASVEDVVEKMRETESPFLMGIETMPAEETQDVLNRMDKAAFSAQSAIADAHKYVSLKMVEVGRLGQSESVQAEMDRVKSQLDQNMEKVKKFQAETQKRKRANLVEGIKEKVDEASAAVEALKQLGGELAKAEPDSIADILEKGLEAEETAKNAVNAARKELQERQQDLRPLEGVNQGKDKPDALKSNSEVLKTKVKVNYMEAELAKFRKIAKDHEEKQKVEKSLEGVHGSLETAETEVADLEASSLLWPAGEQPPEGESKKIVAIQSKLSSTTVAVEGKLQSAQGLELKELRAVFGRLQRTQWKLDRVKETVREITRSVSQKVVKEASDKIMSAEKLVNALGQSSAVMNMTDLKKLEAVSDKAKEAMTAVAEAQKIVAEVQDGGKLGLDGKVEFARLQLRLKGSERKGKVIADAAISKVAKMTEDAEEAVLEVLRNAARDGETLDSDKLFKQMADGSNEVSLKQFQDFFSIRAAEVEGESAALALKKIAPFGLTRRVFAAALQSYYRCVKEISLTAEFEVASAKKVRKIEVGESVEAMGPLKKDSGLGLERVQCRCLKGGEVGWATVKSQSGTVYMSSTEKPYLWCTDDLTLHAEQRLDSKKAQSLHPGEVVELLQGPIQETVVAGQRVRGIACHESTQGWLQVKDKTGNVLAKPSARVFKCVESIAMTDVSDFENCNLLRKIEADEALELLPDKAISPEDGGQRKRFRACRDGKEGWVTTEGSQGTIYVKPAPKHYICSQAAALHQDLGAASSVVRVLMPGEAFMAFEDAKEVSGGEKQTAYQVKSCASSTTGWLFCGTSSQEVLPWCSRYRVAKAVPLTKGLASNEAADAIEVIRLLEPDEVLDAAEPPVEDSSSGQLRMRVSARKDKAVGFISVREGSSAESLLVKPEAQAVVTAAPSTPPDGELAARGVKRGFEGSQDSKGNGKWSKGYGKRKEGFFR
jgi:hypothetical protein